MNRRQFIKTGTAAWSVALTGSSCLVAPRNESLESVKSLAVKLFNSLDESIKKRVCVTYDHPLRQYHNRGVSLGGARIGLGNFTWDQLKLLNRLLYAGLSEAGRLLVPRQYFLRFGGLRSLRLLIAGDPNTAFYQVMLSGPHMNLRLGGKNREGVAFGGPMVYGDQRGDYRQGLPGNVYRYQFLRGQELYSSLSASQKRKALLENAPIQTQIELQGDEGLFCGVAVKELGTDAKRKTRLLIQSILRAYPRGDGAYAWDCLEKNGGIDALHLSYYQEGEVDGSGQYQIFRLEGPAAVFYFRGFPHVHAFINIGMDANKPLSVGEEIGTNPTVLEGTAVKSLFECVMKQRAGTDFAFYPLDAVVGRLRKGEIRAGDIYNLESWGDTISIVSIKGSRLTGRAVPDLEADVTDLSKDKVYTIATTHDFAEEDMGEAFGRGKVEALNVRLRDAAIEHLKEHGFDGTSLYVLG